MVPNRTLLCTVCLCCIHHVFINIHMYLSCIYMNCIVFVGQQHQAAMRPPAAQPQAQVRAPPPARQDPYQGKGVSV